MEIPISEHFADQRTTEPIQTNKWIELLGRELYSIQNYENKLKQLENVFQITKARIKQHLIRSLLYFKNPILGVKIKT